MKKICVFVFAVVASYGVVSLSGCDDMACKQGSGKMITENRNVKDFSKLDISGSYNVVIKQDSAESLVISADDNLMQYITSDVSDHKLRIKSKNLCTSGKLTLTISLRDLSEIKTAGAVNLSSNGKITTKDIRLDMSGASKITLDLNAKTVNTSGAGLTDLNLTGQATAHNVQLSGAGSINAFDFVVSKYDIETSGVSHCKINVLDQLDLNSSGASDVEYRGNPATINNNKSGAASLKKVD